MSIIYLLIVNVFMQVYKMPIAKDFQNVKYKYQYHLILQAYLWIHKVAIIYYTW